MAAAENTSARGARWDEHNAERRRLVIDAAIALLKELPAGSEVNVQQVAEKAGLVRTVVYRHFAGRTELNRAVQQRLVEMLQSAIEAQLGVEKTIREIIRETTGAYVHWVASNPKLYLAAIRDLGDGEVGASPAAVDAVGRRLHALVVFVAEMLRADLGAEQRSAIEILVFGLIGQVRGTVEHWARLPSGAPAPGRVTAILARSIWLQLDGQARDLGVVLEPDVPLRKLLAGASLPAE